MPFIGNTIRLTASFYNFANALTDPTSITLKFFDHNRTQIGADIALGAPEKVSTGIYQYDYTIPSVSSASIVYEFRGLIAGEASVARGIIPVRWA